MRKLIAVALLFVGAGCMQKARVPRPAPERSGTPVAASFAKTWEAVIDLYGDRNLPIRTIDRASGLLVGETLTVGDAVADTTEYDCGAAAGRMRVSYYPATDVAYNVIVRGDSSHSNVKVTARWISVIDAGRRGGNARIDCTTRGKWETEFEAQVKQRAEAK